MMYACVRCASTLLLLLLAILSLSVVVHMIVYFVIIPYVLVRGISYTRMLPLCVYYTTVFWYMVSEYE